MKYKFFPLIAVIIMLLFASCESPTSHRRTCKYKVMPAHGYYFLTNKIDTINGDLVFRDLEDSCMYIVTKPYVIKIYNR